MKVNSLLSHFVKRCIVIIKFKIDFEKHMNPAVVGKVFNVLFGNGNQAWLADVQNEDLSEDSRHLDIK